MKLEIQIPNSSCCSGIGNLFRCSKNLDYLLIALGVVLATLQGIGIPLFSLLWGNLIDSLIKSSDALDKAKSVMLDFVYLGLGVFFAGWGSFTCWMITGSRQSIECRKLYLQKLLKQEIAWFDMRNQEQVSLRFSMDCSTYEKAIGENFFSLVMISAMMIAGTVIAFIHGWLLSLVIFAALPFLVYGYYVFGKASASKNTVEKEALASVGGKMQEIFSSIQTVKMLNGQSYEVGKFENTLDKAKEKIFSFIKWISFYIALSYLFLVLTFTLGYWFGTKCVTGDSGCLNSGGTLYSAGNALLIIFSLVIPAVNLNQLIVSFEKIAEGKAAAARIFEIIDRDPLIQTSTNAVAMVARKQQKQLPYLMKRIFKLVVPKEFKGIFKFQNVSFSYPNSTEKVLNGLNLEITAKSTGIVGESGCGKSTIFQLMMRFYDPSEGRITLDGVDLKEISLEWLHKQIGYVGQEPVLFGMTVKENLLLAKPDANEEEIVAALKEAEAYDFVSELKQNVDTFVGNGGNLISGGQKQRIAIARALIKKPQLLLLDEATSSLDLINEALIQDTLSRIAESIRTVTIAHRTATIKANEELYYIQSGKVSMKGNYQDFREIIEKKNGDSLPFFHKFSQYPSKKSLSNEVVETKHCINNNAAKSEVNLASFVQQQRQQQPEQPIWSKLYEYLKGHRLVLVFAILVTILNGVGFPLFGIFLSKILVIWIQYDVTSPGSSISQANLFSIFGLAIAILGFILTATQKYVYNRIGFEVSSAMRKKAFEKIIKMPLSWFQAEEHSSGHLCVSIDSDCNDINKFTSSLLMSLLLLLSGIFFGVVLAFFYEWRTALVSLGLLPLIGISGFMQLSFVAGLKSQMEKIFESSANIINEAVKNIRTVVSLNAQQLFMQRYDHRLSSSQPAIIKQSVISGVFFGMSYMIMYVIIGLIIYLGIVFKINNNLSPSDVFCAIYLIVFSGLNAGFAIMYFPDISAAKTSLKRIFKLLSLKEEKDIISLENGNNSAIRGKIVFDKVCFKYDGSAYNVLDDVSFEIKAGQKVGVVGHSGCGKSTIVKLIQGFYKPTSGVIKIDNVDLADFSIQHLRQSIGVVNQQPILFNDTVLSNIIYNKQGEAKDVLKLVEESSFTPLSQLSSDHNSDEWLQAEVGFKGSHLSGGQKQRIAVLRALYRKPQLYLLDQATSALDETNEKMVLSAIAKSASNKTVVNVTHRLGCLENFDTILVFKDGALIEQGKFEDLIKKKQAFHELIMQSQKNLE